MNCRRYRLDQVANFRDLGGYACDGGVTRYGVIFRSTALNKATEEDIAKIEHLGVRTVIDLRFPSETKELPDRLGQDMDYINCSLMGTTKLEQLDVVNSSVVETKTLHRMYRLMLRNGGKEIRKALEVVADSEGAILFHCAAGKDRTGILAMLILSSVGVEREDILVDYQCSSTYITKFTTDISGSNIYNMKWILNWIDREWGGVPEYLRQIGVQSETIQKINPSLLKIYICNRLTYNKN